MNAIGNTPGVIGISASSVMPLPNKGLETSLVNSRGSETELREKFTQFVGETFYGQMLKAMRSTVGKPAYFHGGRAEEVFQSQLDQTMAENLTKTTASKFSEPMFERQFPRFAKSAEVAGDFGQLNLLPRH